MVKLAELQKIEDILVSGIKPRGGASLTQLEGKKSRLEQKIEGRILRYYQRIRERHQDAVVPVQNGFCTGCGMQIPPLIQQEIRRGIGFNSCAACGRILMWQEVIKLKN